MTIPKVLHRIWLGSDVPAEFDKPWRQWAETFPDYELRTWTETELDALGMPSHFYSGPTYAERSDVARLEVLNRVGGIYVDCDATPLRRFDHLWTERDRLVVFEFAPGEIWNGCMVAAPGALRFIVRYVARNVARYGPDAAPTVRTGPDAVVAALRYWLSIDPAGVRVYPPAFLALAGTDREAYPLIADDHPDAVVHTEFRWPPAWKPAPAPSEPPKRSVLFDLRLLPVRVRRRVRR